MVKRRKATVIVLVVVVFGVIVGIGLYQNPGTSSVPADEYFQVIEAGVIDGQVEENGTVYIINAISVTFKAVKGDAHDVVVQSWGNSQDELVGTMLKDAATTVSLFSTYGVRITEEQGGFRTYIRIMSVEASGKVYFPLSV